MKSNKIKVSAIYLVIGLGGFLLGKLVSRNAELSELDRSVEKSEQLVNKHSASRNRENTNLPNRPIRQGGNKNLDQKLANLEVIVGNSNALVRGRAVLKWIDTLAPEEFEAAVENLSRLSLSNNKLSEYQMMLLVAWANVDPASALSYTTNHSVDSPNFNSEEATSNVLSAWTLYNPDAAIAWAKSNHEGDDENPYMHGIIRGIAESDTARASALLQDLPFGMVRRHSLLSIVPHLMEMEPESAKKWITEINEEQLRQAAIARYSAEMANRDPAHAASYLLNNMSDRSMQAVDYVFSEWAKVDSAAAIENLESISDEDVRLLALSGLLAGLGPNNPKTAELMSRFNGSANRQK